MFHPPTTLYGGVEYDLSHVFKLDTTITLPEYNGQVEMQVRITVRFSNHCYSIEAPAGLSASDDGYMQDHNGNPRQFCMRRYEMSKKLREYIEHELPGKTCQFTKNNNWLSIHIHLDDGTREEYFVLFTIMQHRSIPGALHLRITTAYLVSTTPANRQRRGRSKFGTIARKTLKGESVRPPGGRR